MRIPSIELSYAARHRLIVARTVAVIFTIIAVLGVFTWLLVVSIEADEREQADEYTADCEKQGGDVRVFGNDEACILDGAKVFEWYRP